MHYKSVLVLVRSSGVSKIGELPRKSLEVPEALWQQFYQTQAISLGGEGTDDSVTLQYVQYYTGFYEHSMLLCL